MEEKLINHTNNKYRPNYKCKKRREWNENTKKLIEIPWRFFFFFFEILNTIEHNNILAQFKISNEPESFYQVSNDFSNLPDAISILLYVYVCSVQYICVNIYKRLHTYVRLE